MIPAPSELRPCRVCARPILWTTTAAVRRLAVDPTPDETGNQACYKDPGGLWRSRSLDGSGAPEPAPWEARFVPHVATCQQRPTPATTTAAPPAQPETAAPPPQATLPPNVLRFDPSRRRAAPPTRSARRRS
ncbi:hypothetical protein JOL79_11550 [Microbispora sp. RL4-1S]|uniref:Uncharacterized protein n=1 Tax=Microbispora oryzae TaxID=2806554 RepID=A0A940WF29_9ACTN|nr:hypothetical protein [Microbispora oryzae]MBP2704449.1 hypothetical protein [Microbispora oryzae]